MPAWMHARAEHILAKNPSMPKSEAFAIATQQSHALGKTPKSYGTATGKHVAKEKYDTPGDDKRTANPGKLKSSVMLKTAWEDKLPGGLSDNKVPEQFDPSALREGRKVEKEHTKDKHLQTEISMDHLTEDPGYYKKLKKMEAGDKTATLLAFYDELQKIAAEKDSEAFRSSAATRSLPATNRAVQSIPQRLPRQSSFQAAPIGMPMRGGAVASPPMAVRQQPPAKLNPDNGMGSFT